MKTELPPNNPILKLEDNFNNIAKDGQISLQQAIKWIEKAKIKKVSSFLEDSKKKYKSMNFEIFKELLLRISKEFKLDKKELFKKLSEVNLNEKVSPPIAHGDEDVDKNEFDSKTNNRLHAFLDWKRKHVSNKEIKKEDDVPPNEESSVEGPRGCFQTLKNFGKKFKTKKKTSSAIPTKPFIAATKFGKMRNRLHRRIKRQMSVQFNVEMLKENEDIEHRPHSEDQKLEPKIPEFKVILKKKENPKTDGDSSGKSSSDVDKKSKSQKKPNKKSSKLDDKYPTSQVDDSQSDQKPSQDKKKSQKSLDEKKTEKPSGDEKRIPGEKMDEKKIPKSPADDKKRPKDKEAVDENKSSKIPSEDLKKTVDKKKHPEDKALKSPKDDMKQLGDKKEPPENRKSPRSSDEKQSDDKKEQKKSPIPPADGKKSGDKKEPPAEKSPKSSVDNNKQLGDKKKYPEERKSGNQQSPADKKESKKSPIPPVDDKKNLRDKSPQESKSPDGKKQADKKEPKKSPKLPDSNFQSQEQKSSKPSTHDKKQPGDKGDKKLTAPPVDDTKAFDYKKNIPETKASLEQNKSPSNKKEFLDQKKSPKYPSDDKKTASDKKIPNDKKKSPIPHEDEKKVPEKKTNKLPADKNNPSEKKSGHSKHKDSSPEDKSSKLMEALKKTPCVKQQNAKVPKTYGDEKKAIGKQQEKIPLEQHQKGSAKAPGDKKQLPSNEKSFPNELDGNSLLDQNQLPLSSEPSEKEDFDVNQSHLDSIEDSISTASDSSSLWEDDDYQQSNETENIEFDSQEHPDKEKKSPHLPGSDGKDLDRERQQKNKQYHGEQKKFYKSPQIHEDFSSTLQQEESPHLPGSDGKDLDRERQQKNKQYHGEQKKFYKSPQIHEDSSSTLQQEYGNNKQPDEQKDSKKKHGADKKEKSSEKYPGEQKSKQKPGGDLSQQYSGQQNKSPQKPGADKEQDQESAKHGRQQKEPPQKLESNKQAPHLNEDSSSLLLQEKFSDGEYDKQYDYQQLDNQEIPSEQNKSGRQKKLEQNYGEEKQQKEKTVPKQDKKKSPVQQKKSPEKPELDKKPPKQDMQQSGGKSFSPQFGDKKKKPPAAKQQQHGKKNQQKKRKSQGKVQQGKGKRLPNEEKQLAPEDAPAIHLPESQVPESQVPESQVPESQVPESQVPESQVPESQIPKSADVEQFSEKINEEGDLFNDHEENKTSSSLSLLFDKDQEENLYQENEEHQKKDKQSLSYGQFKGFPDVGEDGDKHMRQKYIPYSPDILIKPCTKYRFPMLDCTESSTQAFVPMIPDIVFKSPKMFPHSKKTSEPMKVEKNSGEKSFSEKHPANKLQERNKDSGEKSLSEEEQANKSQQRKEVHGIGIAIQIAKEGYPDRRIAVPKYIEEEDSSWEKEIAKQFPQQNMHQLYSDWRENINQSSKPKFPMFFGKNVIDQENVQCECIPKNEIQENSVPTTRHYLINETEQGIERTIGTQQQFNRLELEKPCPPSPPSDRPPTRPYAFINAQPEFERVALERPRPPSHRPPPYRPPSNRPPSNRPPTRPYAYISAQEPQIEGAVTSQSEFERVALERPRPPSHRPPPYRPPPYRPPSDRPPTRPYAYISAQEPQIEGAVTSQSEFERVALERPRPPSHRPPPYRPPSDRPPTRPYAYISAQKPQIEGAVTRQLESIANMEIEPSGFIGNPKNISFNIPGPFFENQILKTTFVTFAELNFSERCDVLTKDQVFTWLKQADILDRLVTHADFINLFSRIGNEIVSYSIFVHLIKQMSELAKVKQSQMEEMLTECTLTREMPA